ncbi:hypothetical protein CLOP_g2750 [Closterium sp. NIES-67]|nr:hypothetical protein CLOP_g2750 [Closterium sp. NIES-67]
MGSHTLNVPVRVFTWSARVFWLVTLALLLTFVTYLSKDKTAPKLAANGGLSACFDCDNGWNWHVLLMGIAFGIAMTESILAFCSSSLRGNGYAKWVHLTWQAIALILSAFAMASIVVAKGSEHKHMYSVHTYCGVLTLALFALQFAWGLCAFVLFKSKLSDATRYQMGTYHILLGKFTYFAGIGTCVNGFVDMQMMMVHAGQPYYGSATMAQNWASIFLWLTSAAVFGAMTTSRTAELVTDSDEKVAV